MSSSARDPRVAELEARLGRLAREKASLALVAEMMASLGAESGAVATASGVLRCVLEHIGGTDAVAWLAAGRGFLRVDAAGRSAEIPDIDSPEAAAVFESGRSIEIEIDVEATEVTEPPGESASTWVFPLGVGGERAGVVRVDALQLPSWEIGPHIDQFFRLAALLLRHEILGESALRRAYAELAATAAELERAKGDLEARVAERTAELVAANERLARELAERTRAEAEGRRKDAALAASEDQLRQAQKMEALGLLAGGVAHDFNNLLQAIVGFGSMLRETVGDADVESVDEILAAATRATELTTNLLAFSRKQPFSPAPLDLNALVEHERRLLARLIGEDIALETRLSAAPLHVEGDAAQLQQVLLNLATNARDAMPRGGRLVVSTEAVTVDGAPIARVRVTDTGVGIAPEDLDRVFEPFFTTKPIGRGTGLGLSIAYGIVTKHGGRIEARSRRGEGTTFVLDLPRLAEGRAQGSAHAPTPPRGRGERVLVVEDEPTVRSALRAILARGGYEVATAADGLEALERVAAGERFDLVVLDMLMPRMNGREALERVRAIVPAQRALLTSGYTADVLDERGAAALGAPLLSKPIAAATLLATVRAEIDRPRA